MPFYPEKIDESICAVESESRSESIEYHYQGPHDGERYMYYWDKAKTKTNQKK